LDSDNHGVGSIHSIGPLSPPPDAVGNNETALGITKTQYDVGQVDFLSVLQMQARTLNSQIKLIRFKNARLAQRVDLHLALGGEFSE
jgi:outer membrane protein TolC